METTIFYPSRSNAIRHFPEKKTTTNQKTQKTVFNKTGGRMTIIGIFCFEIRRRIVGIIFCTYRVHPVCTI